MVGLRLPAGASGSAIVSDQYFCNSQPQIELLRPRRPLTPKGPRPTAHGSSGLFDPTTRTSMAATRHVQLGLLVAICLCLADRGGAFLCTALRCPLHSHGIYAVGSARRGGRDHTWASHSHPDPSHVECPSRRLRPPVASASPACIVQPTDNPPITHPPPAARDLHGNGGGRVCRIAGDRVLRIYPDRWVSELHRRIGLYTHVARVRPRKQRPLPETGHVRRELSGDGYLGQ